MAANPASTALFGTTDEPTEAKPVEIGELSCLMDGETIRAITWNGVEVVRAIAWPVRDQSWITLPPKNEAESLDFDDDEVRYNLAFSVDNGALDCSLSATLTANGSVQVDLSMSATRDFDTNRAGFTVLHPVEGVAGEKLDILHSDGTVEHSEFPRLISPTQPAMDIAGLRHAVDGIAVDIAFDGEVFEMEDQRNWTDASYKTYCRPLVVPFTYRITKGDTIRQTIAISLKGGGRTSASAEARSLALSPEGVHPEIALAVEPGWLPDTNTIELITRTGIRTLQARLRAADEPGFLAEVKHLAAELGASVDLEIVIPQGEDPQAHLTKVATALEKAELAPAGILAVPEPYLMSHQPSGPWPEGPTPMDCVEAARAIFGAASVGGGMLTNFTEFNRCPPDPAGCDFVCHGSTAIVHAADDRSVCETLEALPFVFESTSHLSDGKPQRLGLLSIGMRSNPYGTDVAHNPRQVRQTMARFDPRQCGTFAAAFAVGALCATQGHAIQVLALAAPAGPFGIVSCPQPVPRPHFDANPNAIVYPIFHVIRAATAMTGHNRLHISGLPVGLFGIAAGSMDTWDMVLANLSDRTVSVILPTRAALRQLNAQTFSDAVCDPDWFGKEVPTESQEVEIAPFSVVFASSLEKPA